MSLRCSLLGHSYGEAEIEREREEQGSEVVVTVREFEECERCGEQNVLSENKEVTAIESPAPDLESAESDPDVGPESDVRSGTDAGQSPDAGEPTGPSPSVGESAGPDVDPDDDGAEILGDSGSTGESPDPAGASDVRGSTPGDAGSSTPGGATSPTSGDTGVDTVGASSADGIDTVGTSSPDGVEASAADDDGVILDDDGTDASDGRRPGEWPDADTTHPAEADDAGHADWPDVGREDEGYDAEPGGGAADVDFGGGLAPESAPEVDEDEADEVEFVNAEGDALRASDAGASSSSPELSSGISAGAEAPNLSGPADDPDLDAEFVCPECDYREPVSGSSLRAGDICPECARGYLATE